MTIQDPIEPDLQKRFQTEKLFRTIQECDDINLLKEIAIELVKLNQQKTAIAQWTTKRALEAEEHSLKKLPIKD